jgi:hypothetical protein
LLIMQTTEANKKDSQAKGSHSTQVRGNKWMPIISHPMEPHQPQEFSRLKNNHDKTPQDPPEWAKHLIII